MSRARVLGGLLALILLGCGVVIVLDQRGAFGDGGARTGQGATSTPVTGAPATGTPSPDSSGNDGYGDLR